MKHLLHIVSVKNMDLSLRLKRIDQYIAHQMNLWGIPAVRISVAVIFFWFGILKPLGLSAALPIVKATVVWLPILEPDTWVRIIGWWEVAIGVLFLFERTTRIAIGLLFLQMAGTFMPLVFLPEVIS
ncbi:MAG: hypothetical protein EP344_11665 [Bacteroidetes bacterium]|nr:MAG: hypothetical protein EP344_11665 [Bacteroidota bacterium]